MFRSMDYVYEVYKEKSFTVAAKNLYLSQPALSAAIKKVEQKIGTELFDRNASPVALTDAGRAYIKAVEKIYCVQKDFVYELNDLDQSKTGYLSVSAATLVSFFLLPRIMREFTRCYPGIRLELNEGASADLREKLLLGEIDLLLDYNFDGAEYEAFPILDENILLAVPAEAAVNKNLKAYQLTADDVKAQRHLAHDCPRIDLGMLERETFLLLKRGNDMYDRATAIFMEQGFEPENVIYLNQQMTSFNAARAGLGVAFVTDTLVRSGVDDGSVYFYKLNSERAKRTLYIGRRAGRYSSRTIKEFIRIAEEVCRELD